MAQNIYNCKAVIVSVSSPTSQFLAIKKRIAVDVFLFSLFSLYIAVHVEIFIQSRVTEYAVSSRQHQLSSATIDTYTFCYYAPPSTSGVPSLQNPTVEYNNTAVYCTSGVQCGFQIMSKFNHAVEVKCNFFDKESMESRCKTVCEMLGNLHVMILFDIELAAFDSWASR